MKCPAELYTASTRPYQGLPQPHYPLHDKTVVVTCCGRLCLYRKKINLSKSLAGQAVGVKEIDNGIWLVSFMDYDLGYVDLEEKHSVTYVFGTKCYLCVRSEWTKVIVAEREGFEPSIEFPLYTLSKRAPSTARPSLL